MEDTLDEEEIKIEYNESLEMDPLYDKNINQLDTKKDIATDAFSDEANQVSSTNTDESTLEDTSLDTTDIELSWYESVDKSGRFVCKFCKLKYSTLGTIRFHVKNKHPEHAKHIKENLVKCKRSSKLICYICKERFKDKLALKTHIDNYHLMNLKTSCLHCNAIFNTEKEMSEHLYMQHEKIHRSTHICELCGYRTSIKSHYNQHINTHEGTKTKKCCYCDYATNYAPNLKIHERIHTNDKVYVCDFTNCNYRCTAKSALRSHQLKHNREENALYCDKCSYKTIYKQSLKRHFDCHLRNSIKLKLL